MKTQDDRPPGNAQEHTDILPPTRVVAEKYRLGRLLGEGGMGAVYEAEHTGLRSNVAIKLLGDRFAEDPKSLARFRREARAAASVKHPNIVAVTDTGTDEDGIPFIVMELLEGESLSAVLKRERFLTPPMVVSIAAQLLSGLGHAHDQGVIHRDLKPGNIFLCREADGTQRVKILDFGISKIFNEQHRSLDVTAEGAVIGTPHFMSPEQVKGQSDLDGRADLYAVGVLLYRMLTGRLPFAAKNAEELHAQIRTGAFAKPREVRPEIPEALEAVVLKAMTPAREDRYQDARSLRKALLEAVPEVSVDIRTPSSFPPPSIRTPNPSESVDSAASTKDAQRATAAHGHRRQVIVAAFTVLAVSAIAIFVGTRGTERSSDASPNAGTPALPPLAFAITRYLPTEQVEKAYQPFVDHLSKELSRKVELQILDDYVDFASVLQGGQAHIAALSAYNYVRLKRMLPDLRLLATPVTPGGTTSYQGLILARADSSFDDLHDLEAKVFCYVSATSTSGYLYPRALMRRSSIDPDSFFRATRFTGDHLASLRALHNNACDAAAVFADALHDADNHGMAHGSFRIIATTERIPHDAYCVTGALPDSLARAIQRALLALGPNTDAARAIFTASAPIRGFAEAHEADYEPVRAMEQYLDTPAPR